MAMQAEHVEMRRLGEDEHPSSLAAQAGAFLREARPVDALSDADIAAVERKLRPQKRARQRPRLVPVLAALAMLLLAGAVLAVASGWRPRLPFLGDATLPSSPPQAPPTKARAKSNRAMTTNVAEPPAAQPETPATSPELHLQPPARRARAESASSPAAGAPAEGALSVEARSLADALVRWRRDGQAEAALLRLTAHERRFPRGALSVEARVARAEILLALARKDQALAVLDSLTVTNLPRARELETLRGELRAQAGRCQDARIDLARVLSDTAFDDLGKRAARALATCP
jgi:hypothetical protein